MTAQVIEFQKKEEDPQCSFCKTPKSKAKKMVVSSNGRAICDRCLETCTHLVQENDSA